MVESNAELEIYPHEPRPITVDKSCFDVIPEEIYPKDPRPSIVECNNDDET